MRIATVAGRVLLYSLGLVSFVALAFAFGLLAHTEWAENVKEALFNQ